jgi:cytochrome c biogenesis protein CcdA
MSIGKLILYVLGITQIILLVIALVMLALNKKMSTIGRIFRGLQIVVVPLLGPLFVIIEMAIWRARRDAEKTRGN